MEDYYDDNMWQSKNILAYVTILSGAAGRRDVREIQEVLK